ncbi:hypothetical protein F5B22DRAFT_637427 [Xylaria bambusicola]|uniref:uncharacterized protein n=1 Tax=Xylaria bambusicola TaxID=326684 RepID=UPI0020086240|nr:uncharacterized protein F5B22DRAFT_637427 [Xylaria bambusicola]KAI0513064.1 hypothetical protein F5B22DRAFT_637427 [Xylaria bambusicola]
MPSGIDPSEAPFSIKYPPRADLRKDVQRSLPKIPPGTIDQDSMVGDKVATQAEAVLDAFNSALASNDVDTLAGTFYAEQAFWRDFAALTSHWRTFSTPGVAAAAFMKMKTARQLEGMIELAGNPRLVVASPVLMFIDCSVSFQTRSPAIGCEGRMLLLPVKSDEGNGPVCWKIWFLSTWIESLIQHPEDEKRLLVPARQLNELETIDTAVFILGAGTAGLMAAARLKALGVDTILADRNARIGDNWAKRYDSVKIHVPTSNCEMPYLPYPKELQTPHSLTKDEIAEHLIQYVKELHLNVLLSTTVQSTIFDQSEKKWTIVLKVADGSRKTVTSKHFIQATGFGCGKPYIPPIPGKDVYKGAVVHSSQYRNPQILAKNGAKSVVVVGSANTAFDVIQDCHAQGLQTTMVARSPTYVLPHSYVMGPRGLGVYDLMPLDAADKLANTTPQALAGRIIHGAFSHLASLEPNRYLALSRAGFPVLDSRNPATDLQHHLLERGGGHYVDIGATELISHGKVSVKGSVEPTSYTETGLKFSDGSSITADAVIWCTGFTDFQTAAVDSLGGANSEYNGRKDVLTPEDIVARMDACWGVDIEGETRGMGKRHLRLENYWTIGGGLQHQRWQARNVAKQIKLELEGLLPPAYRETPKAN